MWKLTVAVFAETEEQAEDFASKLSDKVQEMWEGLPADCGVGMNTSLVQRQPSEVNARE